MPLKWSRKPDPTNDPELRKLGDRLYVVVHFAAFACVNSGCWFVHNLQPGTLPWLPWFTLAWFGLWFAHGTYVYAIANYE